VNGRASRATSAGHRTARRARADQPQPLSEEVLVAATLKLIRQNGANRWTMRELASELGVSSMAAYHHVENKRALLALVAEHLFSQVEVPSDDRPWDEQLRLLIRERRRVVREYPGLSEALSGTDSTQARRIEDAQLDILLKAGFSPALAVPAARVLMDWALGNSTVASILRDPKARRPRSRWSKAQVLSQSHPELRGLHADDYFEFGLNCVLAGLRAVLDDG
jgi:AcrR family transcriptional regulator